MINFKQIREETGHYAKAEEHLSKANDADASGKKASFHAHMAEYHDELSQWHESKGRSATADKHADKADYHHEKSIDLGRGVHEARDTKQELRDAMTRHTRSAIAAKGEGDNEKVKVHQAYINKIKDKLGKMEAMGEEYIDVAEQFIGTGDSSSMQMSKDLATNRARLNMMRSIHGDTFTDKKIPDHDEHDIKITPNEKGGYRTSVTVTPRSAKKPDMDSSSPTEPKDKTNNTKSYMDSSPLTDPKDKTNNTKSYMDSSPLTEPKDKKYKPKMQDMGEERTETKNAKGEVTSWKDESDWRKTSKVKSGIGKVTNLSDKARRETEKLAKKGVAEGFPGQFTGEKQYPVPYTDGSGGGSISWQSKFKNKFGIDMPSDAVMASGMTGKKLPDPKTDPAFQNSKRQQGVAEEVDDEGSMAKGQLNRMIDQATNLVRIMDDKKQLDGWVQSKLTMASDYLDSAHDYLMYSKQDVDKK